MKQTKLPTSRPARHMFCATHSQKDKYTITTCMSLLQYVLYVKRWGRYGVGDEVGSVG